MSKQLNLTIEGMTCGHCAAEIKVDPQSGTATLVVPDSVEIADVEEAVTEAGYKLVSAND
jgi:copper chaperone CopZ